MWSVLRQGVAWAIVVALPSLLGCSPSLIWARGPSSRAAEVAGGPGRDLEALCEEPSRCPIALDAVTILPLDEGAQVQVARGRHVLVSAEPPPRQGWLLTFDGEGRSSVVEAPAAWSGADFLREQVRLVAAVRPFDPGARGDARAVRSGRWRTPAPG
jgi:hypothetical protein